MKKKNQIQLVVIAFMAFISSSCVIAVDGIVGKGSIVSEDISLQNFTSVELLASAQVEISKGNELKVTLSDYENLLPYWDIEVVNNKLIIKTKTFTSLVNSHAKVTLELPEALYSATLAGSGDMIIMDEFNELNNISILGSGSLFDENSSEYENLKVLISGSGNVKINGAVQNLNAKITGSGQMQFENLMANKVKCTISGSGNIVVSVVDELDAFLTGSGNVFYSGNPTISSSELGSGKVFKQ